MRSFAKSVLSRRDLMQIYKNSFFYIEVEKSEIPWLKIFTCKPYKELSDCDMKTRTSILNAMITIEKEMIKYYNPKKVNIAMFGNYLPHLHIHVMARFELDSYFPEPMWGQKQREANLNLPNFELFVKNLIKNL
jgi:diadenosine tetraphosphate (Ap4A) HIT family hydrolase